MSLDSDQTQSAKTGVDKITLAKNANYKRLKILMIVLAIVSIAVFSSYAFFQSTDETFVGGASAYDKNCDPNVKLMCAEEILYSPQFK